MTSESRIVTKTPLYRHSWSYDFCCSRNVHIG